MTRGATVVTEEIRPGTKERPTLVTVCTTFGLRRIDTLGLIREVGWHFALISETGEVAE